MQGRSLLTLFFADQANISWKKGENRHDFHRATARVAPTHHFDDVNEMTGKNWDIWAKYHLEKRKEKAYNNSRKSAETKDETVFMDI